MDAVGVTPEPLIESSTTAGLGAATAVTVGGTAGSLTGSGGWRDFTAAVVQDRVGALVAASGGEAAPDVDVETANADETSRARGVGALMGPGTDTDVEAEETGPESAGTGGGIDWATAGVVGAGSAEADRGAGCRWSTADVMRHRTFVSVVVFETPDTSDELVSFLELGPSQALSADVVESLRGRPLFRLGERGGLLSSVGEVGCEGGATALSGSGGLVDVFGGRPRFRFKGVTNELTPSAGAELASLPGGVSTFLG